MNKEYGIWLSWNNQEEGFNLPVLPHEINADYSGDGASYDVYGSGKINVIKDRGLATYTIESFFPAQIYPLVIAEVVLEPRRYVELIMKWWETKRPIRFVYVGSNAFVNDKGATMSEINTPASIESFQWKEVGGSPGDIQYSLQLKEYKFYEARSFSVEHLEGQGTKLVSESNSTRADERVTPKTYTLVAGDNLWKVAQQLLGNGARWTEIQKLNNISDADVKRLPIGKVLRIP